ncbi:hypothetical protein E2C01_067007 [Portunus trituberculatus]|uniref:Uncharacterized protein n=1 Tax=Portunus trituberculatus TaxID=210409 RepID=A0A5B7HSH3_PORTR|nr:hypothetical protein [Portunus trituberculatus]
MCSYRGEERAQEMVVTEIKTAVMVAAMMGRVGPQHRTPQVLGKYEWQEASPERRHGIRLGREGNLIGPLYDLWYVYARCLRVLASPGSSRCFGCVG